MRKFTKEITALMASVAVSAAVGTTNVSSEEIVETEGVIAAPTEIVETAGVALPTDDCTDPTLPPVDGGIMPPDDYTDPTEPIPPLAGEPTMPDEYIEPTTITEPTEEFPPCAGVTLPATEPTEEFPPLAGVPMLLDGDINGDGSFDVADVVTLQNYLSGKGDEGIDPYLADFCLDGEINVFDLVKMKRELIEQSTPELSENNS